MALPRRSVQNIRETGIEVDLDENRYRQHCNDQGLIDDLLALKSKQQDQGQ